MAASTLYLLPVWLGDEGGIELLPPVNIAIATGMVHFFCENERTARRMLRRMSPTMDLNAIALHRLDKDTTDPELAEMIAVLKEHDGAIISEAGMPCIADPGARVAICAGDLVEHMLRGNEQLPETQRLTRLLASRYTDLMPAQLEESEQPPAAWNEWLAAEPELDELYRELILDHYRNPRNKGSLEHATAKVEGYNPLCGDEIAVELEIEDGKIKDVSFHGRGCSISQASGSMMTAAIKGQSTAEAHALIDAFKAMMLEPEREPAAALEDLEAFQGVAKFPVRVKCATLAWHTPMLVAADAEYARSADDTARP